MTTAQVLFSIALGIASLIIVLFAVYVLSSTMWADRWVRPPQRLSGNGLTDDGLTDKKAGDNE